MTRAEFIKKVEELDRILMEEVDADELTDYTRERAHYELEDVIDKLTNNEE